MDNILKKGKLKNWLVFGIILFVFVTFEVVFYFLGYDFQHLTTKDLYIMTLTKYFFLILFFLLYYHKYLKEKLVDFKKNYRNYMHIAFKDWFTGFLIMCVSNAIIIRIIGNVGQNEETVQTLISSNPLIAFALTTLLAPFIEEMIFRKSLQDCFHHKILFMITSGALFGFIHVMSSQNLLEYLLIIPYGSVGFMFAHTLNKTDNIYATITMHAIHNGSLTILAALLNMVGNL